MTVANEDCDTLFIIDKRFKLSMEVNSPIVDKNLQKYYELRCFPTVSSRRDYLRLIQSIEFFFS